ncbi:MAG: radical SAM protein [Planctomycetaceae bacterium]|nr:radical SAM protein [Planctomycetaceae bacterium]
MINNAEIAAARGPRNPVDVHRPWQVLLEQELSASRQVEPVATLFLTNRECPFRCLMCDLWKNTTETTVPLGAIAEQVEQGLRELRDHPNWPTNGGVPHLKLYNSGNFFDPGAVPPEDRTLIAHRLSGFETVIVENHPRLCGPACAEFQAECQTQLEVALGLETSDPATLATLNKRMTVDDFAHACELLLVGGIRLRTFILLRPPGTTEEQGIEQAIESVRFAQNCGVDCCVVIPVRAGNGIMDQLAAQGRFTPPALTSLETVMDEVIGWNRGRCFADLWDIHQFAEHPAGLEQRIQRLERMNLTQTILPRIALQGE